MRDPLQAPGRFVRIAIDLVNCDTLRGPADVREFLLAHDEPEPVRISAAEFTATVELRTRLRAVFAAATESAAAGLVNALLAESAVAPYLTDHDGTAWHLHVSRMSVSWSEWLMSLTAMGLARLLAEGGFHRMSVCAADGCGRVLVDDSRNHRRRFCTTTCATRTRVATHRARRAEVLCKPPSQRRVR